MWVWRSGYLPALLAIVGMVILLGACVPLFGPSAVEPKTQDGTGGTVAVASTAAPVPAPATTAITVMPKSRIPPGSTPFRPTRIAMTPEPGPFPTQRPFSTQTLVPGAAQAATALAATAVAQATAFAATSTALPIVEVVIRNFKFNPPQTTVPIGSTVAWRNTDGSSHIVTAGTFDSGRLTTGRAYAAVFPKPGRYPYACSIHPTMQGQVVVSAPSEGGPVAPFRR